MLMLLMINSSLIGIELLLINSMTLLVFIRSDETSELALLLEAEAPILPEANPGTDKMPLSDK